MKVKAIYEFWAENEAELSFQVGDIITVVNRDDEGWWEGELNGQKGLFPSNYVEAVADTAVSPTAIPPPRASPPAMPSAASTAPPAAIMKPGPPPMSHNAHSSLPPMVKPPVNTAPISTSSVTIEMKSASSSSSSAPAAASSAPREKIRESRTKFGLLSANMALYTGISMIIFGIAGFIWYDQGQAEDIVSHGVTLYCSIYSFFVGGGILAFEWFFGRKRGPNPFPIRGMIYLLLSTFLFLSWPTFLGAFFLLTTACANFAATAMGEVYDAPPVRASAAAKSAEEQKAEGLVGAVKVYIASIQQQNKVGTFVFYTLYTVGNIVLFGITTKIWVDKSNQRKALYNNDKNFVMTEWVPVAKAFGAILDLNCALILLPVLRTIIRYLYNRSTADQGIISTVLRGILYFVPLDSNLKFHKIIAGVIMGATIAHTVAHFVNFALRPNAVFFWFSDTWPIFSGGLVCWFMFFIYSAAFENTKRGQFEIFWYSHHFFIFFFIFLFIHGKHGLNPGYWPYIIGPGALYILERGLRIYRANQRVVVLSCTVMDDVFSLEFAKEGIFAAPYKEGQYVFVNSPPISQVQWHPFTISSAPEEKTVTLHIRVCGDGSWTKDLCNYVTAMGPKHATYFSLDRQGPQGKLAGKILGPDGQRMLCLDGPHSAPTQHVGEYSTALIIGAGIGATPVSATLKSVVFHRWKYFIGQCFPDHAYFMWVCAHRDIDAFRWLIRNIKDAQDEFLHMSVNNQAQMASKTFEFHIWVTSVPKGQKPTDVIIGEEDQSGFWGVPREDAKVEKVRANWDEADLYKTMKCPAPHTTLGNVHVYEGRPNWGPRFQEVSSKHPSDGIGVAFCGNPMIGSDLKKQCFLANQKRNQGFFKLHKENF